MGAATADARDRESHPSPKPMAAQPDGRAASPVDAGWARRIRSGDARALVRQFKHEAAELHRLLTYSQRDVPSSWRDFRMFLAEVGPSPGPKFRLERVGPASGPLKAGGVEWRPRTAATTARAASTAAGTAEAGSSYSQWTMISGFPIQYADVPRELGVSFSALSQACRDGMSLEAVAASARMSNTETADLSWVSTQEAHQDVFRRAFVAWRLKVQPRYQGAATPKFLYLHTLVTAMAQIRAALLAEDLWAPLSDSRRSMRDGDPRWKSLNELTPKAISLLAAFDAYRGYQLPSDLHDLDVRIQMAERRFRGV
jgi:hypothetical protein